MKRSVVPLLFFIAGVPIVAGQPSATGTIAGRVRLIGVPPGNPIIRMGRDPRCAQASRGKRLVQETVVTSADGGLANAFVHLAGSFPPAPPPSSVVTIDQQSCIFRPRVVGARVGQTVQFRNSDETLHDVHAQSTASNDFNVGQPIRGMVYSVQLKHAEVMLHIGCDIHRWMNAYIGVVDHPYFAVSGADGAFSIDAVPPGQYTIHAWHERYGPLTASVASLPGETVSLDFTYTGSEKPDPHR